MASAATKTAERVGEANGLPAPPPRVEGFASEFKSMIADALLFTATEVSRPILRNVLIEADADGTLRCVATDSYTLCVRTQKFGDTAAPWSVMVDRDHVTLLLKVLGEKPRKVYDRTSRKTKAVKPTASLLGQGGALVARIGDLVLTLPGGEGEFPNYRKLMDVTAKEGPCAFNRKYLARLGRLTASPDVALDVITRGSVKPGLFAAPGVEVLIMPVRK